MAIKVTTWSPDTCGCIINYQWDDSDPEDSRTHSFHSTVRLCEVHQNINENHYDVLLDENVRKNKIYAAILEKYPEKTIPIVNEKGQVTGKQLHGDFYYTWSFDDSRNLQVDAKALGLDKNQTASLQANLLNEHGIDKTTVK